jgi:predicted dehydrogenase
VDHWHTKCSIDAMESGKHVYCEKPMTRYLGEAFDFHDAVKRTGKIFQLGSQGCSAAGWHKAAEMIQAGKIGQMVWAQGYYCRNNPAGEWNYTIQPWCTEADLNWDGWQKPVKKKTGFNADAYFRWRKYYPYCAGLLGDLVPHRLNPLMLATGNPEYPKRVVSIGTKSVHSDKNTQGTPERDVPEHVEILAEFPSGCVLTVVCSTVASKSPGFVIYGHKASLDIGSSGESIQLTVEQPFAEGGKFDDGKLENQTIKGLTPTEDIGAHEKNWFECIRTNNQKTNANIDLATKAQTVISLAEMSQRLNMACMFDEKTRKVTTENGRPVKPITYGTLELS